MLKNLIAAFDIHPAHPLDRLRNAMLARTSLPLSPGTLALAYTDWITHLNMYPAKQGELCAKGANQCVRLSQWIKCELEHKHPSPCIESMPHDRRFRDEEWQQWPFNLLYQAFLLQQEWWNDATQDVRGMHLHHEHMVNFLTRQVLDMASPSNFLWTNPKALKATFDEGGDNLKRGFEYFEDDVNRFIQGAPPRGAEDFPVGKRVAVTPGKVVLQNRLIELIQYTPTTAQVKPQPILIVPAWIMKYYILDLGPEDSLVKYLVGHGYTVFMISWKNPGPPERDLGFDDYRQLGVMAALDAINAIVPNRKIHGVGYCLGGTLLTVTAAHMARVNDERLHSMTLLASLTDFSEPGELGLFIDPSEIVWLDDIMWERGYLGGARMRSTFFYLRSLDMIWSRRVRDYLLGRPSAMFDLMAWNSDTTNMPHRMHSEYLQRFYLNNDLVEGHLEIDDEPVMLLDIRVPIFTVGTTSDHIAPWRAVYTINRVTRTEVSFVLTTGGHNVGVVNPPGPRPSQYQMNTRHPNDKYLSADAFHQRSEWHEGSWWPTWEHWLAERSDQEVAPPPTGAPDAGYRILSDAPGTYVLEGARTF